VRSGDDVLAALDAGQRVGGLGLSWLNAAGGLCMLGDGLAEAVGVALAAARWTGGLTDPTVGDALVSLGYDRDFAAIAEDGEPPRAAVPAPGWRLVRLDGPLLRLPTGIRLDLGATAKGVGADRAVRRHVRQRAAGGVLSAATSRGRDRRRTAGRSPWPRADRTARRGADVRLPAGAVARPRRSRAALAAARCCTTSWTRSPASPRTGRGAR
jgi:thiamine biosynthesis lipoprotein